MSECRLKILLVDDDKNIRQTLLATLRSWGHEVTATASSEEAGRLVSDGKFDLLLTDFRMQGKTGIDVLREARSAPKPPISVMMTAYASFENAVNSVKEGAFDYLPKPFSNGQLHHLLHRVSTFIELKAENERLKSASFREDYFAGQTSVAMARLEEFVKKVAPTNAGILLAGESGTGKTELARLIHNRSNRAGKPFSEVHCTTLEDSRLQASLQGDSGTVFLDEIGDLSQAGQDRLLRFLDQDPTRSESVRVIAATHQDLQEIVAAGRFREDLYFRLNRLECQLVPLRYRKEDIPVLAAKFLKECREETGSLAVSPLPDAVNAALVEYRWPGNLRELRNVIERVVVLSAGREIRLSDLPDSLFRTSKIAEGDGRFALQTLEELERQHIERVLSVEKNQERAANVLGITTVTLWRKRKQYGLS